MESFGLLSLATKDMHCSSCAIGLAKDRFCTPTELKGIENMAGLGILKTLAAFQFPEGEPDYTDEVGQILQDYADEVDAESSSNE